MKLITHTPTLCRFSKGSNSNVLGTIWCVKLKLPRLVVGDVEQTKPLHTYAIASTHTAINFNANAPTKAKATTTTTAATKTKKKSTLMCHSYLPRTFPFL